MNPENACRCSRIGDKNGPTEVVETPQPGLPTHCVNREGMDVKSTHIRTRDEARPAAFTFDQIDAAIDALTAYGADAVAEHNYGVAISEFDHLKSIMRALDLIPEVEG